MGEWETMGFCVETTIFYVAVEDGMGWGLWWNLQLVFQVVTQTRSS
jgi:hypothetical protein